VRESHALLEKDARIHFVGNVEGRDVFDGAADVVVCDGFVGNVILKFSESIYSFLAHLVRDEIRRGVMAKAGALLMKRAFSSVRSQLDYAEYGGAPLLGVKGVVIISHGKSSRRAIRNAILVAARRSTPTSTATSKSNSTWDPPCRRSSLGPRASSDRSLTCPIACSPTRSGTNGGDLRRVDHAHRHQQRRLVAPDQACSDLATIAAERALEMAGVAASDLDGIFLGTVSGDMHFPATATIVQDRIGATNAAALDVSAACSGFIYGLNLAHAMISAGSMERVLVIGAEVLSKFVDWQDRSTCVLFGDGAGAAVLEACGPGEGVLSTYMKSDGSLADLLCIPGGGSRIPVNEGSAADRLHYIKMKGDGVFKFAVRAMQDAARVVLDEAGFSIADVKFVVPHQANIRIVDAVAERLEVPKERMIVNLDRYGNTSSATIPIAYDELVRSGRLEPDDLVLFTGFGGGFTWGAVLFRHTIRN
jgi:3-oxoacyl-[acyl-carrier-protein] synthase-3